MSPNIKLLGVVVQCKIRPTIQLITAIIAATTKAASKLSKWIPGMKYRDNITATPLKRIFSKSVVTSCIDISRYKSIYKFFYLLSYL